MIVEALESQYQSDFAKIVRKYFPQDIATLAPRLQDLQDLCSFWFDLARRTGGRIALGWVCSYVDQGVYMVDGELPLNPYLRYRSECEDLPSGHFVLVPAVDAPKSVSYTPTGNYRFFRSSRDSTLENGYFHWIKKAYR